MHSPCFAQGTDGAVERVWAFDPGNHRASKWQSQKWDPAIWNVTRSSTAGLNEEEAAKLADWRFLNALGFLVGLICRPGVFYTLSEMAQIFKLNLCHVLGMDGLLPSASTAPEKGNP